MIIKKSIGIILVAVAMVQGGVGSATAETVSFCAGTGITYADAGTCSVNCRQTAACGGSPFNATGEMVDTRSINTGDKIITSGSSIQIEGVGTINLGTGITIANPSVFEIWGGLTGRISRVTASGENLNLDVNMTGARGTNITRTVNVLIPGANMSGDTGGSDIVGIRGAGTELIVRSRVCTFFTARAGCTQYGTADSVIKLASYACPLAGGSACAGAPSVCSAAQVCQAINLIDNAAFVRYENLPTTVAPGETFTASIVMRNNGDSTWRAGSYRLGSQSPDNNARWGTSRIDLAADVPPGGQIAFERTFTAPSAPGTYDFEWKMLIEGVKWFGAASPRQQIQVVCAPTFTYSCVKTPSVDCSVSSNCGQVGVSTASCVRVNSCTGATDPAALGQCGGGCLNERVQCPSCGGRIEEDIP